ncbi:MAG TPA: membrane protein insertase YidC [Rhodocyclaceae bacterium]|nr:membrane protein insertase YidC [Rhodocyclaceae bacterium]
MDTRRLILLLICAFTSMILVEKWNRYSHPQPAAVSAAADATPGAPTPTATLKPSAPGVAAPAPVAAVPAASSEATKIKTDLFEAVFSAQGGDLMRLELFKYTATEDKHKHLVLLDPAHSYAAQSGLIGDGLPNHKTVFQWVKGPTELAEGADELKVRFEAQAEGAKVAKVYTFKRNSYLVDVAWEVENTGAAALAPHAYFQLQRDDVAPAGESSMVSTFTGAAVFTEAEKYQKLSFGDIVGDKAKHAKTASDGWVAMVQHYFVSAWVPQGNVSREYYARKAGSEGSKNIVQAGLIVPMAPVAPGAKGALSVNLYSGPQTQGVLKQVAPGLDLVVDYGMLTVVAAPIFWLLEWFHKVVGNWGWAIVGLTVLIKLIFFPLSAASYKSMAKMRTLTPRLMSLKERYGDDRQKLNQEMMKLYQTEKINPLGGCLPILVQIPVFIALYWVLLGAVEMRDAPWILWIKDLSAADPFYVLPVIMVVSMVIQTKLNPTPPDPIQAKVMMIMPFAFGFMFFWFPSGLVLYWVVNNILSIAQQWQITRMIESGGKAANDAKA